MVLRFLPLFLALSAVAGNVPFAKRSTWFETLRATRPLLRPLEAPRSKGEKELWDEFWQRLSREFPGATAEGLAASLPLPTPVSTDGVSFHVALDGDDGNEGSAEQPFRSLERARDVLRSMEKTKPVTVWIHGGTYYLDRPLRLEVRDSGTAQAPVIYRAMPGEKVILSGGRPLDGWRQGEGGIWYTDLPDTRDPRFGKLLRPRIIRHDNPQCVSYVGDWVRGSDWRHDGNAGKGAKTATFRVRVPRDGEYALYTRWRSFGNRADRIPVQIFHSQGTKELFIDQRSSGDPFFLGRFRLTGKEGATVVFSNAGTEGYVAVHQVEWLPAEEMPRGDAWRFHQLFVDGKREILARYPNYDPSDIQRKGWLYVPRGNGILAGLGQPGNWVEYEFEIPQTADYSLWMGTATVFETPNRYLQVMLDGKPIPLADLPCSRDWRQSAFGKAAQLKIRAGKHRLRVASVSPVVAEEAEERRVHLDAFFFSDNPAFNVGSSGKLPVLAKGENRVLLEAEDELARTGMESHFGPRVFRLGKGRGDNERFPMLRSDYKQAWSDAPQMEVYTFATWGWFNTITRLDHFENYGGKYFWAYVTGREARTPIWDGNRYYLMNLFSELDAPGEWFLDYQRGRLHYLPREGKRPDRSTIIAPRLSRIITLSAPVDGEARVEHITFQDLEIRHAGASRDHPAWRSTEDCAVLLENAWHCVIRNCRFTNIGGYAVRLSLDSCLNRIVGNEVSDAGAGGIFLRGPWVGWGRNTLSPEGAAAVLSPLGNLVDHNHIHHCGRMKKYVAGIHIETRPKALAYAPGNVYRHNHIHHLPRNGIFGFRNLGAYVVEKNHIHDVLEESDDGGLIHFCSAALNGTAPAIIRQNLLHDVTAFRQDDIWLKRAGLAAASNGHGVYLDGWTSGVTVENNVIRNTRKGCVFIHDGENNIIRNNVLLDDRRQQFWQTRTWNNRWERNVVSWRGESPQLASFVVRDEKATAHPELIHHNLYWYGGGRFEIGHVGDFAAWRAAGYDEHSLVADPRIVRLDLRNKVLEISPDSPAFSLGFEPIDLTPVGILPEASRR